MPKQFFSDQMTDNEKMVMHYIASEIKKAMFQRLPLKTIYLKPQYFQIFEDLNKKCFTEEELEQSKNEYVVQKVHIKKGTSVQKKSGEVDYWPISMVDRQANRERLGMRDIATC